MYETRFALRQRPFRPGTDSTTYYPSAGHERALARLLEGLTDGEGLLLLVGAPGTGKTLLCHCLLERLDAAIVRAFLTNGHVSSCAGLLQAILYDLGLPYEGRPEQELRLAVTDFLLTTYAEGRRTVVVVDEAHLLAPAELEELRLLGNLEARGDRALQVVLAGQPELLETLERPELTSLRQRLGVRTRLEPLPLEEAADYLVDQVRRAGGRPSALFTEEAVALLANGSGGVPRVLNQAAHLALSFAHAAGASEVDAEAALEALATLGRAPQETAEEVPILIDQGPSLADDSAASADAPGDGCRLSIETEDVEGEPGYLPPTVHRQPA